MPSPHVRPAGPEGDVLLRAPLPTPPPGHFLSPPPPDHTPTGCSWLNPSLQLLAEALSHAQRADGLQTLHVPPPLALPSSSSGPSEGSAEPGPWPSSARPRSWALRLKESSGETVCRSPKVDSNHTHQGSTRPFPTKHFWLHNASLSSAWPLRAELDSGPSSPVTGQIWAASE